MCSVQVFLDWSNTDVQCVQCSFVTRWGVKSSIMFIVALMIIEGWFSHMKSQAMNQYESIQNLITYE